MEEGRKYDATERQARLVALLKEHGYCSVSELSQKLEVSTMTIRRDLHQLAEKQIVQVTHGGARLSQIRRVEPDFNIRARENLPAKQAIGTYAASLIKPGDVIGIDGGSTVIEVVRNLPDIPLTIVTYSLAAANEVANNPRYHLFLLGGMLHHDTCSFSGPQVLSALRDLRITKLFLATGGLQIPDGLSSTYLFDAEIKQAMIRSSSQVILCVDSSKMGQVALAHFATLDEIDLLITDTGIAARDKEALERCNVNVMTVDVSGVPAASR